MEIFLIRHTTPDVPKGTCYGATDLGVVETFPEEAAAITSILPPIHQDAIIVSSPLIRCKKLADTLFSPERVIVEANLKEMSFGDWELQLWKEIDKEAMKAWFPNFVEKSPPNGESFQEVYDRATLVYTTYLQKSTPQVFLVAHSAIIRGILSHINQTPLKDAFKENMAYGVVYRQEGGTVTQLK